jgi:uncharacterized protein YndB with AHSA1/START domain
MELKTKLHAEAGKQEIVITREFDLPVELLYKAYVDPEIVAQWMGTKVVKLETQKHGSYHFQTSGPDGNIVFQASGTIHDAIPVKKIVRTFEMENANFGVQMEVLSFEALTDDTSRLVIHSIYETPAQRDQLLKLPFTQGINMAHNRLEEIVKQLN